MNDESSSFHKLREIAKNMNSVEDAKEKLIDSVSLMSEINNLYISITYARFNMMKQLEETAENARKKQINAEESLHVCQILADQNLANIPSDVEITNKDLPPLEQFQEETGISDEEIEILKGNGTLLYRRMDHEIQKIPTIKENYNNANTTRCELLKQRDSVRNKYSFLISKIQNMYDEIMGALKKLDT